MHAPNYTLFFTCAFLLLIVIFLLLREVVCWYSKINKRKILLEDLNAKQEETNRLLARIIQLLENK